ncbi:MAG: HGGxSTG domain-containing protein [Rhodospirillales bacterium]|nr:HGGxSTG domain-containing protein [Rhodospirillales bacterium]
MHKSPRCGAKTRRETPCQSAAMPNGRCRMHGGKSPGAPCGPANGNYRHGRYTKEAIAERRSVRRLIREARELMGAL